MKYHKYGIYKCIASKCRHISGCSLFSNFLGGEKQQLEMCLQSQGRGQRKYYNRR